MRTIRLVLLAAALLAPAVAAAADGPLTAIRRNGASPAAKPPEAAKPPDAPAASSCKVWVNGPWDLHLVDLRTLTVERSVPLSLPSGESLTDVTHRGGMLLGISFDRIYDLDTRSGRAQQLGPLVGSFNALAGQDGRLYAAQNGGTFYEFDLAEGRAVPIARFPDGLFSSGDVLVLPSGKVLATATASEEGLSAEGDVLLVVDPGKREVRKLGRAVRSKLYGLSACGDEVFGFTEGGEVLTIDDATGKSAAIGRLPLRIWGAASRPESVPLS